MNINFEHKTNEEVWWVGSSTIWKDKIRSRELHYIEDDNNDTGIKIYYTSMHGTRLSEDHVFKTYQAATILFLEEHTEK